jgi:hypothetical protein
MALRVAQQDVVVGAIGCVAAVERGEVRRIQGCRDVFYPRDLFGMAVRRFVAK